MSAPTLTPAELVQQWLPRLRRLAWRTGLDVDDIKQEAWLLAATLRPGADLVPRWLVAVERHARAQAPGLPPLPPGDLVERAGGDDPAEILVAVASVADMLAGHRLDQVISMPRTTREMMQATGKSESQARRDLRRLEALARVQGEFWPGPPGPEATT